VILDLPQGLRELRLRDPEDAQGFRANRRHARERVPRVVGCKRLGPHRLKLARGAGEHDDRGPIGGHDEARSRSGGSDGRRSLGDQRLLPVGLAERLGVEAEPSREPGEDLGDPLLHLLVQDEVAPGKVGDHLRRQVVRRGPEPAAGDDELHAQVAQEPQRRPKVGGAVAHAHDVGHLHAELAQSLGDPRAVAIRDPAGKDLGAGDDDAGAHGLAAHGHFCPW
jgi:hypothetical protein